MAGPAHTAATEISGTLDLIARPIGKAWIGSERYSSQGQFDGNGHSDGPTVHVPPPGSPAAQEEPSRGIVRKDRADYEQSCASANTGEWIELVHVIEQGACFPHAPQRIQRR